MRKKSDRNLSNLPKYILLNWNDLNKIMKIS